MPQLRNLHLSTVFPDPEQPRKTFTEGKLRQLANSLAAEGLLQPITVRPHRGDDGETRYMIIAGERRYRAATMLKWDTIPALVDSQIDDRGAAMRQLLENIVRADLDPVEEAEALRKALAEGATKQELSKAVGIPVGQIGWRVDMLSAPDEVLDLVKKGHVSPSTAYDIAMLPDDKQMPAFQVILRKGMTYQQAHDYCLALCEPEQVGFEINGERELSTAAVTKKSQIETAFGKLAVGLAAIHDACDGDPAVLIEALQPIAGLVGDKLTAGLKNLRRIEQAVRKAKAANLASVDEA